jgi:hypothetical protein
MWCHQEDEYQMLFVLIMIVYIVLNLSCHSGGTICFGVFMDNMMCIIFESKTEEVTAENGKCIMIDRVYACHQRWLGWSSHGGWDGKACSTWRWGSDGRVFKNREFLDQLLNCSINSLRNIPYSAVTVKDVLYYFNSSWMHYLCSSMF